MRTGVSAVDGNTSTIEPRRATSPRCSTRSSRRYPMPTSCATRASGSSTAALRGDDGLDVFERGGRAVAAGPGPTRPRPAGRARVAQPPQHLEAPAHGLHRRAHPLERQRLPRREQLHRAGARGTGPGRRRAAGPPCRWAGRRRSDGGRRGGPAPPPSGRAPPPVRPGRRHGDRRRGAVPARRAGAAGGRREAGQGGSRRGHGRRISVSGVRSEQTATGRPGLVVRMHRPWPTSRATGR